VSAVGKNWLSTILRKDDFGVLCERASILLSRKLGPFRQTVPAFLVGCLCAVLTSANSALHEPQTTSRSGKIGAVRFPLPGICWRRDLSITRRGGWMRPSDFTIKFYRRMRAMPIAFTCLVCWPGRGVTLNAPLKCSTRRSLSSRITQKPLQPRLAYQDQGQLAGAVASYKRALALKPDYAKAANNLGIALRDQGRLAEAVASYRRALALKPDFAEFHGHLGIALKEQGKLAESVASYQRALALKADNAEVHTNLGIALSDLGKLTEAVASYARALA
jgi:hypothetical protein